MRIVRVLIVLLISGSGSAGAADPVSTPASASATGSGSPRGGAPAAPSPAAAPARGGDAGDPVGSAQRLDRALLIAAVLERNPSLEAARRAWSAAAERPAQAAVLDDPMLSYGVAPLSIGSSAVPFGHELEIAQGLPYRGKRGMRGAIAAAEAEVLRADLATLRLELARRAAILHAEYVLVDEALRINAEHVELLEGFFRVATDRYMAGLASQQDPLQAESELAHLFHQEVVLSAQREVVVARLNTLLHRPPGAPLPPAADEAAPVVAASRAGAAAGVPEAGAVGVERPRSPGGVRAPAPPAHPERSAAAAQVQEALASRPELEASAAAIRAREAELELARLAGRPDFGVMASYSSMWREGEHRYMLGGSVSLPIRRARVRAGVAEAEARLAQAQSESIALTDEVRREVHEALTSVAEAEHVLELYASRLVPVAHDRVEAALAGFRAGKNDFLALIEAERNLRDVELDREGARAELVRSRVELERALGRGAGEAALDTQPAQDANEAQPVG